MEIEMEIKKVYAAAVEGRTSTLKPLIQEDPLILDRITSFEFTSFPETPLHISVLHGHLEFTRSLLTHNPSLATESDSLSRLPLHVASLHGHLDIILELLRRGAGTCMARDKDGRTPLHLAIVEGVPVEVVKVLTRACPESTRLRLDKGETILHLCVKHNNLQALKVLLEDLDGRNDDNNLLNSTDDDGNTIFHLATVHKYLEIMKYLLTRPGIELNAVNNNGHTALDLIENSPRDMKSLEVLNLLLESKAERAADSSSLPPTKAASTTIILTHRQRNNTRPAGSSPQTKSWKQFFTFADGNHHLEEIRGALFVSLGLVIAMAVLPLMIMKVNDTSFVGTSPVSPWSLVPALTIVVLFMSGLPLNNKLCVWLVVQLVYTTIGVLSLNYIGEMLSFEDRYFHIEPPFYIMCVWFLLLCLASLLNMIRLIVLIVTTIKGCVKRRN